MRFEWDENKNLVNIKKHRISFEEAIYVFTDRDAISIFDEEHSESEERWITIGKIIYYGIIVVVHTERIKNDTEFIRIISARKATIAEEGEYILRIGGE